MTHSPRFYWFNCLALLALLAATWGIGYIDLGVFNLVVALAISFAKMMLIALFFMHMKGSSRLLHLAAVTGFVWLLLMFGLTLSDYLSRGVVSIPTH